MTGNSQPTDWQPRTREQSSWTVKNHLSASSGMTESSSYNQTSNGSVAVSVAALTFEELHKMLAAKYEQLASENRALAADVARHRPNGQGPNGHIANGHNTVAVVPSDGGTDADDAAIRNSYVASLVQPPTRATSGGQLVSRTSRRNEKAAALRESMVDNSFYFDAVLKGAGCGCNACRQEIQHTVSEESLASESSRQPSREASAILGLPCFRLFQRKQKRHQTLQDALAQTRVRIARKSQWVINPEQSTLLQTWDKLTMTALAFVAFVTPFQVAMLQQNDKVHVDLLLFVNFFVDFIFFIDMCLQFFIMYQVPTKYGYVLEHRQSAIVMNYLKTWFVIDLFSTLPFDLVSMLVGEETKTAARAVKLVRLVRLLKLVRILRASRVFRRIEVRMSVTYQRLALVKFFVMLMLITHWMACLWALSLNLHDDEDLPRWVDSFEDLEVNVEDKTRETSWKLYIACFYFTSYTITSVGYGDIGPQNIVERIICTCMIFVSGISWALVLAQVTGIVGHMDASEQDFRKVMDELNFFMEDRKLPPVMRHRLRSFFLANKTVRRRESQEWVVERMSPSLKGEVFMEMNRMWMQRINFLNDIMKQDEEHTCSRLRNFLVAVAQMFSTEVHAQMEIFGSKRTVYILCRGIVARNSRVFLRGAVWGLDGFLLSRESNSLVEPVKSLALSYVEVLFFSLVNFQQVHEQYKCTCPEVADTLRRHCLWLALQRTIWAEAKRRQKEEHEGEFGSKYHRKRRPPSLTANLH